MCCSRAHYNLMNPVSSSTFSYHFLPFAISKYFMGARERCKNEAGRLTAARQGGVFRAKSTAGLGRRLPLDGFPQAVVVGLRTPDPWKESFHNRKIENSDHIYKYIVCVATVCFGIDIGTQHTRVCSIFLADASMWRLIFKNCCRRCDFQVFPQL